MKGGKMLCTWLSHIPTETISKAILSHQDRYHFIPNKAIYYLISLLIFSLNCLFQEVASGD